MSDTCGGDIGLLGSQPAVLDRQIGGIPGGEDVPVGTTNTTAVIDGNEPIARVTGYTSHVRSDDGRQGDDSVLV